MQGRCHRPAAVLCSRWNTPFTEHWSDAPLATNPSSSAGRQAPRRKRTQRLLAGISAMTGGAKPAAIARSATASRSRTPHAELRRRRSASNAALLGAVWPPAAPVRAVEEQQPARRQHARGAAHEPDGRGPRRDVDHVDAHDDVGARDRPGVGGGVERQCRQNVRQPRRGGPRIDAGARLRIGVARLKHDLRTGEPRKVHRVLARSARHLEHQSAGRQLGAQHGPDRIAIARRRRREQACISAHALLLLCTAAERIW